MWLVFLALLLNAYGNPSLGPTSEKEASFLWQEGQKNFQEKNYSETIRLLKRLTDLYPGKEGFVEAHLFLGLSYLESLEPAKAVPPLKYFIESKPTPAVAMRSKISLGKAFLGANLFQKALLVSEELLRAIRTQPALEPDSLVLKAQALFGLGRFKRAEQTLLSYKTMIAAKPADPELHSEALALDTQIQASQCEIIPVSSRLDEENFRIQMRRRGTCLVNATLLYQNALNAGDAYWVAQAEESVSRAFKSFWLMCNHPVNPPDRLTGTQILKYKNELAEVVKPECRQSTQKMLDLLNSWTEKAPAGTAFSAKRLANYLKESL